MPFKYLILASCLPLFLACNMQFELPRSEEPQIEQEPTAPPPKTTPVSGTWEQELLNMVNEIRASGCRCGNKNMPPVDPLQLDTQLIKAAQIHADDMYSNRFFDHTGSDGSKVSDRADRVGFKWNNIGENISQGYPTVTAAFNGWKKSSGHCKNMMSSSFQFMGAAQKGSYWVQTLGRTG